MDKLTKAELDSMKEIVPPNWLNVLGAILGLWMLYHVVISRTATDILINSVRTGAVFFVVIALVTGAEWYFEKPRKSIFRREALTDVIPLTFMAAICGVGFYIIGASMKDLALWVPEGLDMLSGPISWSSAPTVAIAVCIPLIIGGVLFSVRHYMQSLYGVTETLMGVVVFMSSLSAKRVGVKVTNPAFALVTLTASIYLVVRGLDNVFVGWEKKDRAVKLVTVVTKWVRGWGESRA